MPGFIGEFDAVFGQLATKLLSVGNVHPLNVGGVVDIPIPRTEDSDTKFSKIYGTVTLESSEERMYITIPRLSTVINEKTVEIGKWTGNSTRQQKIASDTYAFEPDSDNNMDGRVLHTKPLATGAIFLAATDVSGNLNTRKGRAVLGAVYTLTDANTFSLYALACAASTMFPVDSKANLDMFFGSSHPPWYNANLMVDANGEQIREANGDPATISSTNDELRISMDIPVRPETKQIHIYTAEITIPRRLSVSRIFSSVLSETDPLPDFFAKIIRK